MPHWTSSGMVIGSLHGRDPRGEALAAAAPEITKHGARMRFGPVDVDRAGRR